MMDFDVSKENIQPLRGGRNAEQLELALQAQNNTEHQQELLEQRRMFENMINTYTGDDPLHNWYHYIYWLEQCFPKHGHEGNFQSILEHCLGLFEADARYLNDRRLCKLMIKYIDMQEHQEELYQMMYSNGIGRGCADVYKAWAYYHELAGDFHKAYNIFELAVKELAQPMDELLEAKECLVKAAGEHMLFGRDDHALFDRRHALTSLATYKPGKVGSVRIPSASGPGTFGGAATTSSSLRGNNALFSVYEQKGQGNNHLGSVGTDGAAASFSIIQAAKRLTAPKENVQKAGPWTSGPMKKRMTTQQRTPGFTVHEDAAPDATSQHHFPPVTMETYSDWLVPMTNPEPQDDRIVPMYPKSRVYGQIGCEFSLEELRARRYRKDVANVEISSEAYNSGYSGQLVQETNEQPVHAIQRPMMEPPQFSRHLPDQVFADEQGPPICGQQEHNELMQQQNDQRDPLKFIWGDVSADGSILNTSELNLVHSSCTQQNHGAVNDTTRHDLRTAYQSKLSASHRQQSPYVPNKFDIYEQPSLIVNPRSPISNYSSKLGNQQEHQQQQQSSYGKFVVYEQPSTLHDNNPSPMGAAKVVAMKTPFKDLTAEELAETGSRGGMDVPAASPVDCAKRLPFPLEEMEDSPSVLPMPSGEYVHESNFAGTRPVNNFEDSFNTQTFNLNAMIVSTPIGQKTAMVSQTTRCGDEMLGGTKKQLFVTDVAQQQPLLSTIYEESSKSYVQSSSSGASSNTAMSTGAVKSLLHHVNQNPITAEHHNNLAQNLKANEELRRSFYDSIMSDDTAPMSPTPSSVQRPLYKSNDIQPFKSERCDPATDPFSPQLIANLLSKVGFPGPHTHNYYYLPVVPKLASRKETMCIGPDRYLVDKLLGKGTFGVVYRGEDTLRRRAVALKYQKPCNKWEFYVCRELQCRLRGNPLTDRFMDVTSGYFSESASILISDFVPSGSLLDVANSIKQKSGRPMKECLCIHFCLEMVRIIKAMHSVEIIHADIKPDNFLVKVIQSGAGETVALQLIDFGCAIDMSLLPAGIEFTRKITTEDFICCEMLDDRPWNYHTDLFCIAATAHVLLFDKYIRMQKRDGVWSICQKLPRYTRVDLWNEFFSTLLNQQRGPADTRMLEMMLIGNLEGDDYTKEIRNLTNILKNR